MDDLLKIVKLVLLTGNLKDIKPVSLLIISKSGNGKTQLITSYKKRTIIKFTDLTYSGLISQLKENPKIKHVIIPDFIKITQKKRSTTDNLVSLLNAALEEGIDKIKMYNTEIDLKGKQIGLITATTKESFNQRKKAWHSFGFLQRMLIVTYDYSDDTIDEILESIAKEEYLKDKIENIEISNKDVHSNKDLNIQLKELSSKNFRTQKNLQSLAKANALLRKSKIVEQEDIDEIIRLTKYMNFNYTKI